MLAQWSRIYRSVLIFSLPLLFVKELAHGFGVVFLSLGVHGAAGLHAGGADLSGEGAAGGAVAVGAGGDGAASADVHLHGGGSGDGVLIGGQEEELPILLISILKNKIGDVCVSVGAAGILKAVGKDHDDDLARLLECRQLFQTGVGLLDGATDGIEQGGGAAGHVGAGIQQRDGLDRESVVVDEILVIKEDKGESGIPGDIELGFDKLIEPGDGGLLETLHGARAVQHVRDLDKVCVHAGSVHPGWDNGGDTPLDFSFQRC